jgi:hypothetical protein
MKPRLITYRLTMYASGTEEPDYQVEATSPSPAFEIGHLIKSEPVAGFANETVHGKVGRVLHYMYAATDESFVCHTMVWLAKSDWWDTGEHVAPLAPR